MEQTNIKAIQLDGIRFLIRSKRKDDQKKGMCGDDDKEHKRENVSGDHQTGDDRSPTVSPRECGGSRPTGFLGSPHPNIGKNVFHCDPKSLSSDVR